MGKQGGTICAQFERLSFFVSGNDPAFIPRSMGASKEFADTGYVATPRSVSRLSNGHVFSYRLFFTVPNYCRYLR